MPAPSRVLLVGDSLTGNTIRQIALEEAGYKVVSALGARVGLREMREHRFDVAVVDGYFAPSAVKDVLVGLQALGIPTVLIAPAGISEELKSLAQVQVPLTDVSWLTRLIPSVLEEKRAAVEESLVPLGVGGESVQLGNHLAWLCANQQQLEDWVRFMEVGFERGDCGMVAGDLQEFERVTRILAAHGVDVGAVRAVDKLQFMDMAKMISLGDDWVSEARRRIDSVDGNVRILGSGSGRVPWRSEESFYQYEEQVDRVIEGTRCVVACLYELKEVSGTQLWYGGLGKHGVVVGPSGMKKEQRLLELGRVENRE